MLNKYEVNQLSDNFVIVKNNKIVTDSELESKGFDVINSFWYQAEAFEICDALNKPKQEIKLIICDAEKLKIK